VAVNYRSSAAEAEAVAAGIAGAGGEAVAAVHAPDSLVEVWVIPTDEGQVAASEAARLLAPALA
jgi:acetate kinase